MTKDYGQVKTFRLQKNDEKLLNECFEMLTIMSGSFNSKIPRLIYGVHKGLEELQTLRKKVKDQEEQIKELNKKIPLEVKEIEKPKPPKSEAVTPTQTTQKLAAAKEEPSKEIKPGECLRGIRSFQWDVQCKICRDRHPSDYAKCDAPQKPKGLPLKRW
jgi:hypothetical protein